MALSPEEIRHVSIKRRVRGYDRRETERLLADIAQSFEKVWHERTDLYEEANRLRAQIQEADRGRERQDAETKDLRERLKHTEAESANLREEAKRLRSAREVLVAESERAEAEMTHLRQKVERLEDERSKGLREEERLHAELNQLGGEAERLRGDRGRLREESKQLNEEVLALREDVDRLDAEHSRLAKESQRSAGELDDLQKEVTRLEAERSRLLQESARSRAESVEFQNDPNRDAELADLPKDSQRPEPDHADLRDHLQDTEAELETHPWVSRLLRELGETRARYRDMLGPGREPEGETEAKPPPAPNDHVEEVQEAQPDPPLLNDLDPEATERRGQKSASEPFKWGGFDA
jgi:chromosome segregation ATPase